MNNRNATYLLSFLILALIGYVIFLHYKRIPEIKETYQKKGDSIGYSRGHLKGAKDVKASILFAINGSEYIFIDENNESKIPIKLIVDNIYKSDNNIEKSIDLLYDGVINSLSDYLSLSTREKNEIVSKYNKNSSVFIDEFKQKYQSIVDSRNLKYDERYKKVEVYSGVIATQICNIIDLLTFPQKKLLLNRSIASGKKLPRRTNKAFTSELDSEIEEQIKDEISNNICSSILQNSLTYLNYSLIDYAAIKNFSEYLVVDDVKTTIVRKLSTTESNVNVSIGREFIRNKFWGFKTAVNFNANVNVSAGVDLDKYFSIEIIPEALSTNNRPQIIITLPEPEILNVDVNQHFDVVNKGWYQGIKDHQINALNTEARERGVSEALRSGILERAKSEAENAIKQMYYPLLSTSTINYDFIVNFRKTNRIKG